MLLLINTMINGAKSFKPEIKVRTKQTKNMEIIHESYLATIRRLSESNNFTINLNDTIVKIKDKINNRKFIDSPFCATQWLQIYYNIKLKDCKIFTE